MIFHRWILKTGHLIVFAKTKTHLYKTTLLLVAYLLCQGGATFAQEPLFASPPVAVTPAATTNPATARATTPLAPSASVVPVLASATAQRAHASQANLSHAHAGPPKLIKECQIIARINGQPVLACEVLFVTNQILAENRDRIRPGELEKVREMIMKQQVAALIDTKLVIAQFQSALPEERIQEIKKSLYEPFEKTELPRLMKILKVNTINELELKIRANGASLEDLRQAFFEKTMSGQWVRQKISSNRVVTPYALRDYYNDHLSDYDFPTQARWEEIVIRFDKSSSQEEAYRLIANLGNQIWKAYPNPTATTEPIFTKFAKGSSHGYNADTGGLHDWTTQGSIANEKIDETLFAIPVGQLSSITKSEYGFHILRVLERKPAGRKPFTEMQAEIQKHILNQRHQKAVQKFLVDLRKDVKIWTIYDGHITLDKKNKPLLK